jgi:hypothetical protein
MAWFEGCANHRLISLRRCRISPSTPLHFRSLRIWRRILAAGSARGLHRFRPVQRAQGRPGASCTRGLVCCLRLARGAHEHTGTAGASRPSLRNGFTAYFVLSPENGSFASVAGGKLPASVMPAPRHQNHTTSPYASGAYVYRAISVHRISPRVRDVRERPSFAVRRAELCR